MTFTQMAFIIKIILTLYAFFYVNATTYKFNDKTFNIGLYFDFYKSSKDFVKAEI